MSENGTERPIGGRTALAFILAPLLGGLLFGILATWPIAISIGIASGAWSALPSTLFAMVAIPFVALLVMAPVMYLGMAVIGLPALILFRHMRVERWWTYGIWGTVWTFPLLLVFTRPPAMWVVPAGGIILILFWAIARRRPSS